MTDFVQTSVKNSTGVIELTRPKALNSLDHAMNLKIHEALDAWRDDDTVTQVLIYAPERSFCAGGDVRLARENLLAGKEDQVDQYFVDEYDMNNAIAEFPKPYIALIDGVVMGGGLGVSAHGSHRIITEKAFAAMPEMAIGYVPDVGVTYMTSHMVGRRGKPSPALAAFIGLVGYHLKPADMLWSGLATHIVDSADVSAVIDAVINEGVDAALERFGTAAADADVEDSTIARMIDEIEECFSADSWAEIAANVAKHEGSEFADLVAEWTAAACPTSLVGTAELYAANRDAGSVREALDNELAVGRLAYKHPNFVEGVRAVLVDKDRKPAFQPAKASDVDPTPYREALGRS